MEREKTKTNQLHVIYVWIKNAAFEEPVCSNSVEVTEQSGILQCQFQIIRKIETTVR